MSARPALALLTHRHAFSCEGSQFVVETESGLASMSSRLYRGQVLLDEDFTVALGPSAELRNHLLRAKLSSGRLLKVEAGHVGWGRVGVAAWVGSQRVHEGHPGRELRFPWGLQRLLEGGVARRAALGEASSRPADPSPGNHVLAMLLVMAVLAVVALA